MNVPSSRQSSTFQDISNLLIAPSALHELIKKFPTWITIPVNFMAIVKNIEIKLA
jgi:hypothetical protein